MSNEPMTIFCRRDYVRPGELTADKRRTKEQRHALYERNRRKANAPDRCWNCRFFTDCPVPDCPRGLQKYRVRTGPLPETL